MIIFYSFFLDVSSLFARGVEDW